MAKKISEIDARRIISEYFGCTRHEVEGVGFVDALNSLEVYIKWYDFKPEATVKAELKRLLGKNANIHTMRMYSDSVLADTLINLYYEGLEFFAKQGDGKVLKETTLAEVTEGILARQTFK